MDVIKQTKQTNKQEETTTYNTSKQTQERPFGCRSSFHGQGSIYHNIGFYIVLLLFKFLYSC